jgi:hypothetical protein
LNIELGGTTPGSQYDQIHVTGQLTLGGTLNVWLTGGFAPAAGNSFDILDWGSLTGTFASIELPTLATGLQWNTSQLYTTGTLSVVSAGLAGDFNLNGIVDAADYAVWRKGLGTTYNANDYNVWRAHFGQTAGSGSLTVSRSPSQVTVQEPASALLLMLAIAIRSCGERRIALRFASIHRRVTHTNN